MEKSYYKIAVEKIDTVTYKAKEYQKIADTGNERDGGAVYGYVSIDEERDVVTTILLQKVKEVNLEAIIKAINNIK